MIWSITRMSDTLGIAFIARIALGWASPSKSSYCM